MSATAPERGRWRPWAVDEARQLAIASSETAETQGKATGMNRLENRRWLRMAMPIAIVYPVVGIAFGALANPSTLHGTRIAWRLAAWWVCAAAFAAHLGYEHFRLRSSPSRAALHVSVAVALGAFALAVWVNVHAHWGASPQSPLAPWALVAFPVVTGAPAFVVALVAATVLARARRRGP